MQRDLILTRDAAQPSGPPDLPAGFTHHFVERTTDDAFALLRPLYVSDGYPPDWPAKMCNMGATGVVIASGDAPAAVAVAAAWLIRKPYYVGEIRRTFDPGSDADYYFGDFVLPEFRGKHLQRALIRARLELTRKADRRWAIGMTRLAIPASYGNFVAEGFVVTAHLTTRKLFGWRLDRTRLQSPHLPHGQLSREGLHLPFSCSLRRAK